VPGLFKGSGALGAECQGTSALGYLPKNTHRECKNKAASHRFPGLLHSGPQHTGKGTVLCFIEDGSRPAGTADTI